MTLELVATFVKRFPNADIRVDFRRPACGASVTVLFGPSGCGKTTILRCLAGLERPEEGRIRFGDEVWMDAETRLCLPPQRRDIGFLFQDYALFPHLTVAENIGYALTRTKRTERRNRVTNMLARFQLEGLATHYPGQISGGEQQRVALARALMRRPRLLLLDEPLAALDTTTRDILRGELRALLRQLEIPVFLVSHDLRDVQVLADFVLVMDHGQVIQQRVPAQVFERSAPVASVCS